LVASLTDFAPRQFLERIITADEIWVHHYEPESKAQSVTWNCPTSPVAKKFKSQPSAGKIMLTLFWDMEGAILVHFTLKSETVYSQNCCDPNALENYGAKLVIDATKNFFVTELKKKTYETLKSVR
jgi:hypothetical protein